MHDSVMINADIHFVVNELEHAGFHPGEINLALDWLDGLCQVQEMIKEGSLLTSRAMRFYSPEESDYFGTTGKGFLLYLEQVGILDPMTREVVIDRVLALPRNEIDLGRIKWIVLIALFNQPEKKSALTLLQDLVLSGSGSRSLN